MIEANVELYGLEESVNNNIAITVSRDIAKVLNLPEDTHIILNKESKTTHEKNVNGDIVGTASTPANELLVLVEDGPAEGQDNLLRYKSKDWLPIFHDTDTGIIITPIYNYKELIFRFRFASESKSKVFAIANTLADYTNRYSNFRYHNVEYSFPLGNSIMNLLHTVNSIRNMKGGDNLTFREYIDKYHTGRIVLSIPENLDLKQADLSVQEKQYQTLGQFDMLSPDTRPEFNPELSRWELDISYKLDFEKPIRLNVKYPILIYNTLIPEEFRNLEKDEYVPIHLKHSSVTVNRHYPHNRFIRSMYDTYPIINIPKLDKWYPMSYKSDLYIPIMSLLCMVDKDDTNLFNLNEITGIDFHKCVKDYIINIEGKTISKSREGIFLFKLFENDRPSKLTLTIDENGNIIPSDKLDIRKLYRVVIYIIKDLKYLTPKATKNIYKILNSDCNTLLKYNYIEDDRYVGLRLLSLFNQDVFNMLLRGSIDTRTIEYKLTENNAPKTVNVFTILTTRAIIKRNRLLEEGEVNDVNCE